MTARRRSRENPDHFVVLDRRGLDALPAWLRRRAYTHARVVGKSAAGATMVTLLRESQSKGLIFVRDLSLLDAVHTAIGRHLRRG